MEGVETSSYRVHVIAINIEFLAGFEADALLISVHGRD